MTELDTLLESNKEEIDLLAEQLKDVLTPEYDRIWLLRYILSNKTAAEAEQPCRFTIKWLKDHANEIDDMEKGIKHPLLDVLKRFQCAGEHKFMKSGEPMMYVRIGLSNPKGLMDHIGAEMLLLLGSLERLKMSKYCDIKTRQEGRLIKFISVLDFQGYSVTRGMDSRFSKVIGESSKLNEMLFPQFLGNTIFINVPSYIYWTINLVKPLMSKRATEKMRFCPGQNSEKEIAACPFVVQNLDLADIPSFLGGKCNCQGGCINGVPNSQTSPLNDVCPDGFASLTVTARKAQNVDIPCMAKGMVKYSIKINEYKVQVSVKFIGADEKEMDVINGVFVDKDTPIDNEFVAAHDGTLLFTFDNSHSLLRTKNILYKIEYQMV